MTREIDWDTDQRVIIRHVDAVAIWLNERDQVVISQEDPWDEDDAVISFPREQADRVVKRLKQLMAGTPAIGGTDE